MRALAAVTHAIARYATGLNSTVATHPLASSVLFGVSSKWCIDLIVQLTERQRGVVWAYDVRRGVTFAVFGLVYLGVTQQQIYFRLFPWLLSRMAIHAATPRALMQVCRVRAKRRLSLLPQVSTRLTTRVRAQVFLDQVVVFPLVYFPLFYGIQVSPVVCCTAVVAAYRWRVYAA